MKRMLLIIIMLSTLTSLRIFSSQVAISLGPLDGLQSQHLIDDGVHAQLGTVIGIAPQWEAELFAATTITPILGEDIIGGAALSFALMGPVYTEEEVPPYGNALVGLGFLGNISTGESWGPVIRMTVLTVGGPRFVMRERGPTLSLFYDIPGKSVTLLWNIFLLDFYL